MRLAITSASISARPPLRSQKVVEGLDDYKAVRSWARVKSDQFAINSTSFVITFR